MEYFGIEFIFKKVVVFVLFFGVFNIFFEWSKECLVRKGICEIGIIFKIILYI